MRRTPGGAAPPLTKNEPSTGVFGVGILVLGAVACEALFTIFGKALTGTMSPIANCYLVCLYGMLMFLPLAIWQARWRRAACFVRFTTR